MTPSVSKRMGRSPTYVGARGSTSRYARLEMLTQSLTRLGFTVKQGRALLLTLEYRIRDFLFPSRYLLGNL